MASRHTATRPHPRHLRWQARRQEGAFAVMFIPLLLVLIAICGLALDIGHVYNRRVDMYGVARAAALAAARELNGTKAGIAAAKDAAREAVAALRYHHYNTGATIPWSDDALSFSAGAARGGTWIPSGSAQDASAATVGGLFFARVDTAQLAGPVGQVDTVFLRVLASNLASVEVADSVIAGRTSVNMVPIGICAMSPSHSVRSATSASGATLSELVQFGFRRGVSYDLMKLNPNGTSPARFAINPAAPGASGGTVGTSDLEAFVCTGSMWISGVNGGTLRVSSLPDSAPLAGLRAPLNTRFDQYGGTRCAASGAAPDINIKSYTYDTSGIVKWMNPGSGSRAAESTTVRGKLETVADLPTPPASPGQYGPLWAYAKAVKAPASLTTPEPAGGFAKFLASDWATLYKSGPTAPSYPSSPPTPYFSSLASSGNYSSPSSTNKPLALPERRVLNIPLLQCSASTPSGANVPATLVGAGKFFMTVPATDDSLIAEFAGVVPEQSLSGRVELFP